MKLILASNNSKKLAELRDILKGLDIELLSQREAGVFLEAEENGATFAENASLKARAVTELTGCAAVADDSGLVVDALGGAPGVYSARYGCPDCESDEDRNRLLLKQLGDSRDRSARFVCCVVCTFPNGEVIEARGECEGSILTKPRGNMGFGYDPVFQPENMDLSMAQLAPEEKNKISHRGKALREFIMKLREYHADN